MPSEPSNATKAGVALIAEGGGVNKLSNPIDVFTRRFDLAIIFRCHVKISKKRKIGEDQSRFTHDVKAAPGTSVVVVLLLIQVKIVLLLLSEAMPHPEDRGGGRRHNTKYKEVVKHSIFICCSRGILDLASFRAS